MAEVEFNKAQLIELIRHDCELFLGFYLGEELTLEVPDFHHEIWDEFLTLLDEINEPNRLTGILKKMLGVPREHAKTTLVKLACLLFLRYSRLGFLAYVSNTFSAANNALKDIRDWITGPQEVQLYGAPTCIKSSESEGLYIYEIWVPGRMKPKPIIMKAFGQGTQIRGTLIMNRRPDFLVFDDIESKETTGSPENQAKLDDWALGTALKSMAKLGVCIFIGNMLAETSLLARISKEKEWRGTVFGSIIKVGGKLRALWEGRWTLDALLADYASYLRLGRGHTWEAEMMNLTGKEIFGQSLEDALRPPTPMPEEIEAGFICLDPAFGKNSWNDESAITVHIRMLGGNIPIIVDHYKGRVTEEALFDEMLAMSYKWGLTTWVIESVAAQRLLISLFRQTFILRQMSPDFFLLLPIVAGKESKASRIVAMRNAVANQSYAISEDQQEVVDALQTYSPDAEHDDLPDSAAYGVLIWATYNTLVQGEGRVNVSGALMLGQPAQDAPGMDLAMNIF